MPFQLLPEEKKLEPGVIEQTGRLGAQAAKGVGSTLAGAVGDVGNLLNMIAKPVYEAVSGQPGVEYEETYLGKAFPTTATHKSRLEKGIPYLKPQNKLEKFVDEVASDATAVFLPGKKIPGIRKAPTLARRAGNALTTSLGANVVGKGVEMWTGDEQKGAYAKMGSLFLLSMLNRPGASEAASSLYQTADQQLSRAATTNATGLQQRLTSLQTRVLAGRGYADLAPSERFVVDQADRVLRQIQNGTINVNTAVAAKRSLNEELTSVLQTAPTRQVGQRARVLATEINHSLRDTLEGYSSQNPQWWTNFSQADQAFGTIAQSNFMTRAINQHIKYNPVTHGLLHLLGVGTGVATKAIVPYQAAKIAYRAAMSPTIRNHYMKVLTSAAAEDAVTMNKEIEKMDKVLQKEEKSRKKKYQLLPE